MTTMLIMLDSGGISEGNVPDRSSSAEVRGSVIPLAMAVSGF